MNKNEKPTQAREYCAREYKLTALRDCPLPEELAECNCPKKAAAYWRQHIVNHPGYNPDAECLAVLLLNTRKRVKGHLIVSTGTLDTLLVHPREVFRAAIIAAAAGVVIMHNHPSGDPIPSEADVRFTHDLIRAGQLLKIPIVDHVVVGAGESFVSLYELGYFFS